LKIFYITTPIYYPNGIPHVGTAYTTIAADILARWHRMKDGKAFFLTGTDEHGQKVEKAAKAKNLSVQDHVDGIVKIFQEAWSRLFIQYDDFIRTTQKRHVELVEKIFASLLQKGEIYKGFYEGWYCVSCETFWLESQLVEMKCPNAECRRPVEWIKEEEYFFRLSAYQERLLHYFNTHPTFVLPQTRYNEVKSLVAGGLQDVCVSRKGLRWGIPVPGDPERSIYVWIDALTNYITAIDYLRDENRFYALWPADVHLVGKDILRFHAVIWPALLMALEIPLPKMIFVHGWLTIGGAKISKSRGEYKNLMELLEAYGADPLRYFLMREAAFGEDLDFSEEGIIRRLNTDLANDLGNLVHRVLSMIQRYFDGKIPSYQEENLKKDDLFQRDANHIISELEELFSRLAFREALMVIFQEISLGNKYVDEMAPWKLKKENNEAKLGLVLYSLAEHLRKIALLLAPFLPQTAQAMWEQIGLKGSIHEQPLSSLVSHPLKPGMLIGKPVPLFQKVETAESVHD
jgi:methionyl-tRNA synthetase